MGTLQSQAFTASGTFNVPAGVTSVWLTMIGGGGGGGGANGIFGTVGAGGGGGAGECCERQQALVTSGGTVTVTIGAGGAGGAIGNAQDAASTGGTSFFGAMACLGGWGGVGGSSGGGGQGGGKNVIANAATNRGDPTPSPIGKLKCSNWCVGGAGGAGENGGVDGHDGAVCGGYLGGPKGISDLVTSAGSGGGASTIFGLGAAGVGTALVNGVTATSYGSGGSGGGSGGSAGPGAHTTVGGAGAPGYCLVAWVS